LLPLFLPIAALAKKRSMDPILIALADVVLRLLGVIVLCGFMLGAALFAADVAARAYLGHRLFPFAAPSGGVILIVSWLALIAAALAALRAG
jgi:uncharacterized membrane protein YgdD (TMEM256/DUF423 family)